jgi:hypothetical protein
MANQLTRRGFLYSAALTGGALLQGRSPLWGREQWIQTPDELKLWYRGPASEWVEALPIGNGKLGAMVFGGIERERLQLNEDTLWSGGPTTAGIAEMLLQSHSGEVHDGGCTVAPHPKPLARNSSLRTLH